jgi:hypothetical protein
MSWWVVASMTYVAGWAFSLRGALDIVIQDLGRCPRSTYSYDGCRKFHGRGCWVYDGAPSPRTTARMWGAAGLSLFWPIYVLAKTGEGFVLGGASLLKKGIPQTPSEKRWSTKQAKLELEKDAKEAEKLAKEFNLPSTEPVVVEPTDITNVVVMRGSYKLPDGTDIIVTEWSSGLVEKKTITYEGS